MFMGRGACKHLLQSYIIRLYALSTPHFKVGLLQKVSPPTGAL